MTIDPAYYAPGGFGYTGQEMAFPEPFTPGSWGTWNDDPLSQALGGAGLAGGMDPGGGAGLAALGGLGGMMVNLDDASSYWGEHEGQGWVIAPGTGETPMGLPELEDPLTTSPADTPIPSRPIYDPPCL